MCALQDQFVTIEDGLIKQVSSNAPSGDKNICDYGNSICMPGLINLHCHLDYSNLSHKDLPQRNDNRDSILFSWIPDLIAKTSTWSESDYFASALRGAKLAALSGTSFVVDNSFQALPGLSALARLNLKGIVGLELFGIDPQQANAQFKMWHERFEKAEQALLNDNSNLELTVSPHAPYTVSPQLWSLARDFALKQNRKVLAHVAESKIEFDWFNNQNAHEDLGFGQIDRFLLQAFTRFRKQEGVVEQVTSMIESLAWRFCGHSPVEHLRRHQLLDSNLLATHLVMAQDQDIDSMRQNATSVALCPVSNYLLANGSAPIEKFVSKNLKMGLGTDSLASSYSLDMRATARFALANSSLDSKKLLSLLTIDAAKALGKENQIGSIQVGKSADILILTLPFNSRLDALDANIFDLALYPDAVVEDLFVSGKKVVSNRNLVQAEAL